MGERTWQARGELRLVDRIVHRSPPASRDVDPEDVRQLLRKDAVHLTARLAPQLHERITEARERLSDDTAIEIWQGAPFQRREGLFVHAVRQPVIAEVRGLVLAEADPTEILALVGTILGHGSVHAPGTAAGDLYHEERDFPEPLRSRLAAAAGISADRYALVAARHVDAVLRLRLRLATGLTSRALAADLEAMRLDWTTWVEGALATERRVSSAEHADALRAWALERFSDSDRYRAATGEGPGTQSFEELEEEIGELLDAESPLPAEQTASPTSPATQTVRDSVTRAGAAIVQAADRVRRLATTARDRVSPPRPADDPSLDDVLRDDAEEELLARFAELERRSRGSGSAGDEG